MKRRLSSLVVAACKAASHMRTTAGESKGYAKLYQVTEEGCQKKEGATVEKKDSFLFQQDRTPLGDTDLLWRHLRPIGKEFDATGRRYPQGIGVEWVDSGSGRKE